MHLFRAHATRSATAGLVLAASLAAGGAAAAQDSRDAEIRFNAGLSHLREGRAELAVEEFKKAIDQEPKNPYFHKGLGQALASQGRYKDAIDSFKKALDLNPYFVDVRNDLGTALVLSGKREEGKQQFLAAYNDPTNPTPELTARNLGQSYFEEKRYDEALNWFRTSLSRNPRYPDAHLGLADTLAAAGSLDAAIAQLEKAVDLVAEHPPLLLSLGQAYYRAGRFTEARAKLESCAKVDPAGPSGLQAAQLLRNFPR